MDKGINVLHVNKQYTRISVALKIAGIYILIGALWILLSDKILAVTVTDKETVILVSMIKGWVYVLLTGGIILFLMLVYLKKIKGVHHELNTSEAFSKIIINKMLNAYALHKIILDDEGKPCDYKFIDVNPSFEAFTGLKKEEVIGKRYKDLIPEDEAETTDWVGVYGNVAATGVPITFESYTAAFDKWVVVNAYSLGEGYFATVFDDISKLKKSETELKAKNEELTALYEELTASEEELRQQFEELSCHRESLRISEERFRLAAEGSNDMIWDTDLVENKVYFSDRWYDLLGFERSENEDLYTRWAESMHPEDAEKAKKLSEDHLKGKTPIYSCEYRLKCKNSEYRWFLARGKALFDEDGRAVRISGSLTDINDMKRYGLKLQENAYHDLLTGLPNRLSLYENFTRYLEETPDERKALLFIDSDNFKFINDTMGHSFGDQDIIEIGKRLSSLFEDDHEVYRLGGDEFIIYCCGFNGLDEIEERAGRIIQSFNTPFEINNSVLHTTVSIGISICPEDGGSIDELMRSADIAMYRAKSLGKNKYVFYSHNMQEAVRERMMVERHLRSALQNNELLLYYQPQLDVKTGKISGFEALLRWDNPELGFVPPLKFIGIAEETHLIVSIGQWVLRSACLFLKGLHIRGHSDLTISVNISILQLLQEDFVDTVLQVLESTGINPMYLELEITESILMESYQTISDKLCRLKDMGVKIALDDFGRGYSSLSYLKQLPINTLKIDKSFIDGINSGEAADSLTGTIVMIGRKMGLTILAEGVESREQMEYLTKHRCQKIQGFLISKPLPQDEAGKFCEEWN